MKTQSSFISSQPNQAPKIDCSRMEAFSPCGWLLEMAWPCIDVRHRCKLSLRAGEVQLRSPIWSLGDKEPLASQATFRLEFWARVFEARCQQETQIQNLSPSDVNSYLLTFTRMHVLRSEFSTARRPSYLDGVLKLSSICSCVSDCTCFPFGPLCYGNGSCCSSGTR